MLFKFRSRSTAPVLMLERSARRLLHIIGKSPSSYGILRQDELARTIEILTSVIEEDESARKDRGGTDPADHKAEAEAEERVSLRQRAWPLIEMMERSQASGYDITWDTSRPPFTNVPEKDHAGRL